MKKIFLLLLIVSPVFSQQIVGRKPLLGTQINWSHPLAQGLVGCWLFKEGSGNKVYDLSGNGNVGTLTNMTESDWVPGKDGFALNFDGSNDFIDITNSLSISPSNAISIVLWFKNANLVDNGLIDKDRPVTGVGDYTLAIYNNSLYCGVNGVEWNISGVGNFPNDEWAFVAMTYDKDISPPQMRAYKNGIEIGNDTYSNAISTSGSNLEIGRYFNGTVEFRGFINYVYIYNRALTAQEIWMLYVNPYAIFEQPLYGRRLKAAVAGGASGPGRLPQIIKIESEKKFFVKDSLYASGNKH